MKYYEQIDLVKIKDIILKKARYQKVIILIDSFSNLDIVNQLEKSVKKETVCYSINLDLESCEEIAKILNDGTRCVVSFLNDYNYLKLSSVYDFQDITIDVFSDKMFTLHLKNYDEYYLFCRENKLSLEDRLIMYNYTIEWKWQNLISGKNYSEEEKILLKTFNRKNILELNRFFGLEIYNELLSLNPKYYSGYLFIRILAVKYLFLAFFESSEKMIDVYKFYSNDLEEVNLVYKLYKDERVNFLFKNCNRVMLDFIDVIMSSFSLKLNITKIEANNLLKNIKINAKNIKKDNLLKYCYLYGIFENI